MRHRDTDANSLNRRAVIANAQDDNKISFALTTHLDNATAHLVHLHLHKTKPSAHTKAKDPILLATFYEI